MKNMFSSDIWWTHSPVQGIGMPLLGRPLQIRNGQSAMPAQPAPAPEGRIPLGDKGSCPVCPSFSGQGVPFRRA